MTATDIVNAAAKQKAEEEGWNESEEGESVHISHSMALECVNI
jgi:hypothetical protein